MLPQNIAFVALLIQLLGGFYYILDMVRGTTHPNRVSWTIWALAPLLSVWFSLLAGAGLSVLPVFMAGFNPILVLIASFIIKKGYWRITAFDLVCGGLALLSLALWMLTRNLSVSIIFSLLADALAAVPTIIKSWKFPTTETVQVYSLGVIANALGFLTITKWTLPIYAPSIYFIIVNLVIVFSIKKNKFYGRKHTG